MMKKTHEYIHDLCSLDVVKKYIFLNEIFHKVQR